MRDQSHTNFYFDEILDEISIMNDFDHQCMPDMGSKKEYQDGKLLSYYGRWARSIYLCRVSKILFNNFGARCAFAS